jgi:hypothetical protein
MQIDRQPRQHIPNELVVLYEGEAKSSDLKLIKLAAYMGVPARGVPLAGDLQEAGIGSTVPDFDCIAGSANAIRQLLRRSKPPGAPDPLGASLGRQIFVYGFDPDSADSELVRALSCGAFESVRELGPSENEYSIDASSRPFCQEFSGLTFGRTNPRNDVVFHRAKSDERISEYIRIGGNPFLASVRNASGLVMLAGTRQIVDIDEVFPTGVRLLDWFSRLVPVVLFLRHVFGERCWHGAGKRASLVVDDPLLRERYGFLQYESLLKAMEQSHFATSMAFIPWNYRRSQRKVIDLFKRFPKRYSLSVHGCDHTKAEFATGDKPVLRAKAQTALQRMTVHQQLTGVPFDRVMVFPGGHFSAAAMEALANTSYLAAVNSTEFAMDNDPQALRLRDVLDLAILRYSNFPIFVRRYPQQIAEFALDLFLGRPALIVVHHQDFEGGYQAIQAFAEQLNQLSHGIVWCGLEEIIRRTFLCRRDEEGVTHVRLYTNQAVVENLEPAARRFSLEKALGPHDPLPPITVSGTALSARKVDRGFCVEVELKAGESADVRVGVPEGITSVGLKSGSLLYRMNVLARRYLCEFRDNYLGPGRLAFKQWLS